jgi:hypothetical protein
MGFFPTVPGRSCSVKFSFFFFFWYCKFLTWFARTERSIQTEQITTLNYVLLREKRASKLSKLKARLVTVLVKKSINWWARKYTFYKYIQFLISGKKSHTLKRKSSECGALLWSHIIRICKKKGGPSQLQIVVSAATHFLSRQNSGV